MMALYLAGCPNSGCYCAKIAFFSHPNSTGAGCPAIAAFISQKQVQAAEKPQLVSFFKKRGGV